MRLIPVLSFLLVTGLAIVDSDAQNSKNAADVLSGASNHASLATFDQSETLVWKELKSGVNCYGKSDRYQWESVPAALSDIRFSRSLVHAGKLSVKVKSGGLVFIATSTRWKGGGNSSGDWLEEAMDERELRRAGWRPLRQFKGLTNNDTGEWLVFYREAKAGESFSIRTEKYAAPVLLNRYPSSLASTQ